MTTTRLVFLRIALAVLGAGWFWSADQAAAKPPGGGGGGTSQPRVIAFVQTTKSGWGRSDLRVMDANGGSRTTVASNISGIAPRWSPDGQRLLFSRIINSEEALVHTAADGSDQRLVVTASEVKAFAASIGRTAGAHFWSWDWSPDAGAVVFSFAIAVGPGNTASNYRLFTVQLADGTIGQLTDLDAAGVTSEFAHINPRWSRSLDVIAYVRMYYANGEPGTPTPEVRVVLPDGSSERLILAGADYSNGPANWSNGGDPFTGQSSLAFAGAGGMLVADVDLLAANPVSSSTFISSSFGTLRDPDWSPDDTKLVLRRSNASVDQIATYDLVSGTERVLLEVNSSREGVGAPTWRAAP